MTKAKRDSIDLGQETAENLRRLGFTVLSPPGCSKFLVSIDVEGETLPGVAHWDFDTSGWLNDFELLNFWMCVVLAFAEIGITARFYSR